MIKCLLYLLALTIFIGPGLVERAFSDMEPVQGLTDVEDEGKDEDEDFVLLGIAPFDTPIVKLEKVSEIEDALLSHISESRDSNSKATRYSIVGGQYSEASRNSLAVGYSAKATGGRSVAIGDHASAKKADTFALGYGTLATNDNAFVWNGFAPESEHQYGSHGIGTFNILPGDWEKEDAGEEVDPIDYFFIGNKTLRQIIDERIEEHGGGVDLEAISQALDEIVGTQSEE